MHVAHTFFGMGGQHRRQVTDVITLLLSSIQQCWLSWDHSTAVGCGITENTSQNVPSYGSHPASSSNARSMTLEQRCHTLAADATAASWRLLFLTSLHQSQCHEALRCGDHRVLGRPRLPAQYPPAGHKPQRTSMTRPATGHGSCGRHSTLLATAATQCMSGSSAYAC